MPHSAGGGSHGGGFHSSGSHGSSGKSRISRTYFHGARRYRRHYLNGRPDDYIYAREIPNKTNIFSLIITGIVGAFFVFAATFGIINVYPSKLKTQYMDAPAIHDDINVIDDEEEAELQNTINDYCELTGICPVIYTVYSEDWNDMTDLESYTYNKYIDNFKDEQHLVIVYSIPENQADLTGGIPDYEWHIVQGDDTDKLLSETVITRFGRSVQNNFELGKGVGESLNIGFKRLYKDADSVITPGSFKYFLVRAVKFVPLVVVLAIFVPMMIMLIVQYRKDKNTVYEEVPLDLDLTSGDTFGIPVAKIENSETVSTGGTITPASNTDINNGVYSGSSGRYGDETDRESFNSINKAGTILSAVVFGIVLFPFVGVGIGMVISGIVTVTSSEGGDFGYLILGFGILWLSIVGFIVWKFIKKILGLRNRGNDPDQPF